ncbi:SCO family protein [soil metagenome]
MKPLLLALPLPLTLAPLVAEEPADDEPHPVPAADASLPQGSLYVLDATWTDQDGKPVVWSESLGTPRVVALGYATCKGICPRVIADMQRIEKGLDANSNARFTFVTLDPENDQEAELIALAKNHVLTPGRWDLLRGDEDALLELAVALGIRFNRLPNGIDFAHSYLIAILGPDGKVLHKWTDPNSGPDAAIKALNALSPP